MADEFLTVAQAAALLGVKPDAIWHRIRLGSVRCVTFQAARGTTYLIDRSSLLDDSDDGPEPEQEQVLEPVTLPEPEPAPLQELQTSQEARLRAFVQHLLDPLADRLEHVNAELSDVRRQLGLVEREKHELEVQLAYARGRADGLEERSGDGPPQPASSAELVAELQRRAATAEQRCHELERRLAAPPELDTRYQAALRELERRQQELTARERERDVQLQAIPRIVQLAEQVERRAEVAEQALVELQQAHDADTAQLAELRAEKERIESQRAQPELAGPDHTTSPPPAASGSPAVGGRMRRRLGWLRRR
jgi:hypothetical protein